MLSIIREEDINAVDNLRKEGANKDRIEGYLLFNGYSKKDAIAYLKEIGVIGRVSYRAFLYSKLLEGYYSIEDFELDILKFSDNTVRHLGAYNLERCLGNNISAKYDPLIALLVGKERPLTGAKGSKKEKAGDSSDKEERSDKEEERIYKSIL